jgi:hypothetical protein
MENNIYPIAKKFKAGTLVKPTFRKDEFYKGGLHTMQKRFQQSMRPFPGAHEEFLARTEDMDYSDVVFCMWDYVKLI